MEWRIKLKKPAHNTVYKKLLVLASTKFVACLPSSDFPHLRLKSFGVQSGKSLPTNTQLSIHEHVTQHLKTRTRMKKMTIIFALLILISCSNDDEKNNSLSETDIELVTGINIRNSEFSTPTQLGNPNVFTNNQFVTYPNPPTGTLSLQSSENISDIWITPANAKKIHQQTDFNLILNSDLYAQSLIESNAEIEFLNLNSTNLVLNLENLTSGYYRVFVKINEKLYWDNIYIPESNFDIYDLITYWN